MFLFLFIFLWSFSCYFSRVCNTLWYIVLYYSRVEHPLVFCVIFSICGMLSVIFAIFCTYGTRSGILYYIFLPVERALVCFDLYFHMWNTLWYFVLYLSSFGMCSGILLYIFLIFSSFFVLLYLPFFLLIFLFRLFETIFDLYVLILCNFVLKPLTYGKSSGTV